MTMSFFQYSFLVIFCYSSIVWCQSSDLEASISEDNCEFYNVLEKLIPCGKDGYVQGFAEKYCPQFLSQRNKFKNIEWNNGVHMCLEKTMLNNLRTTSEPPSCSQIYDWGFNSHSNCYLQPIADQPQISFCTLSASDIARIALIVKGGIFNRQSIVQVQQMLKFCLDHHLRNVTFT